MFTSAKTLLTSTVLSALLLASHIAIASTTVVGSTPAEFNVSGGQASYSIPIQVAPGRGGMQPDLSLNYTGGGNGVLGMGWSLGGLSSVHRCTANLEQDGFISGITFSSKDRYCLDGQRLIPVSGSNGGIGTEYKTEIDGYSHIKSYGGSVNNPSYFIAKTKAGQVITFGGGSGNVGKASVVFPQGITAWAVREINDSTGNNPVGYEYSLNQYTQYLGQVIYSGGKVEVVYEARSDVKSIFFAGVKTQQIQRISEVRSFANTVQVEEYRVGYSATGANNYSVIDSVKKCDHSSNCLNPIQFEWDALNSYGSYGAVVGSTPATTGNYESGGWSFKGMYDTNGDGLLDAVWLYSDGIGSKGIRIKVSLAQRNGSYGTAVSSSPRTTGNFASGGWSFKGMHDTNGDGLPDAVWVYSNTSGSKGMGLKVSLSRSKIPQLEKITDSNGNTTQHTYKSLTDPTVHTKGTGAQYPVIDLVSPQYVVSQVKTSNGIGGTSKVNYHYKGLKMHVRGRGSYGYSKITESYSDTGKSQETFFNQTAFPLAGNVERVVEKLNGQIINESQKTFLVSQSSNGVYAVNLDQSVDKSYELNGDLVTTVTTSHSNIDAYGNIGTVSVTTSANGINESFTKSTESTYYNDVNNWYLGRLSQTTVTHQAPNQTNQQRRSQFTYDSSTGLLDSESVVSMATGLPLTTTSYQYDAYGHKTQVSVSAASEPSRTSTTTYNSEGKPTQSCNQLNQCESYTYTPEGWVESTTGPNGITTTWEYDSFGRKTKEIRADGTETTIANYFSNPSSGTGSCGVLATHAYTCSISQSTGSQPTIVQYDALGRELRKIATGFDGRLIYSDTEYNHLAQVTRVSRNYFMGDQLYWANSQYDLLGRVTQMDEPAPHGTRNIINTSYNGLNTTVTSGPEQRQKTTQTNAIGQVIHRGEEEGSYVEYTYTADGNLKTTTVAGDNATTITLSYDEFGRKIGMDDPDMGVWSYTYRT